MKEEQHPKDAQLVGWFDAELAEPEGAAVEAHLAGCPECRLRARRIEEASDAVAACREAVFQAAVAAPVRRIPAGAPWRRGAYALAAVAAAAVAAILLMPARPPVPAPPPLPAAPKVAVAPMPGPGRPSR